MLQVHVLASGSDGNCTVIECDGEAVMIDAGISCRRILGLMEREGVDPSMVKSLLITHEHSDHIAGAGPTARKLDMDVYCNRMTYDAFNPGAVKYNEIHTLNSFSIGAMNIMPLPTSHNAAEPNAFLVECDGKKALVATDTGVLTFPVEQALADANVAVIEANYDNKMLVNGPYPYHLKKLIGSDHGHLSNVDCAAAVKRTMRDGRQIFLAHLSKTNNTPDVARETVAEMTGIRRLNIDCLEFPGDTRTLKV